MVSPSPPAFGEENDLLGLNQYEGIDLALSYDGEIFANLDGGAERGAVYQGVIDLSAEIDLEQLIRLPQSKLAFNVLQTHGKSPSSKVGDDLLVSNIDAADTARVQNLWLGFSTADEQWSFRIGAQAVDDEFMTTDGSSLFLHMAAAYPFTLSLNAPPWPVSSMAGLLLHQPDEHWTFRFGVYDADADNLDEAGANPHGLRFQINPDQLFFISEVSWQGQMGGKQAMYRIGAWQDTNSFFDAVGNTRSQLTAFYLAADQQVHAEEDPDQGLFLFSTMSWVLEEDVAPIDYDIRFGGYWRGPLQGRDNDTFGIFFGYPHVGEVSDGTETESLLEIAYQATLKDWWSIQGSVQRIRNPGGASGANFPDATTFGLRSSFSF